MTSLPDPVAPSSPLTLVPSPIDPSLEPSPDTIPDTLRCPTAPPPSGPRLIVRKSSRRRFPLCDHQWQPIEGWRARYHCAVCGAYGLKRCEVDPTHAGDPSTARYRTAVRPYRCEHELSGHRCSGCATVDGDDGWRCPKHSGPPRGSAKRAALTRSARRDGAGAQVLSTYSAVPDPRRTGLFNW